MNIKSTILIGILSLAPLSAQQLPVVPPPGETPLKQYLQLTDAQVSGLRQVQSQRQAEEQKLYQAMSERQQQLNALLQDGSNDAATVGRLTIEINNLRRQLPLPNAQYRAAALAVLTDAQKAKLPALAEAMRLSAPANEAAYLDLIDRPDLIGLPRPLPMPVAMPAVAASATVVSEP